MEPLGNPERESAQAVQQNYSLMTVVLCWSGLVIMSSLYITIPLIATFADVFKVELTQAAWASTAFSFCFALGCLVYGPLSDRVGRKSIMLLGLSSLAVISLLTGLITDLSWLILLRGLQGAAAATFSPVALAYVVEVFPIEKRVTTIGFINTGFLMAAIIGQIFSSYVSQFYGWNAIFYSLGIVYIVTAGLILWFIPRSYVPCVELNVTTIFSQLAMVLTRKSLLCAYAIALTILLVFVGMYTALNDYLSSPIFGFTAPQIFSVRAIGIIGMLLSPYSGRLVEQYGLFAVLRSGMALSIIGLLLLGFGGNLSLIVIASILFVAGTALFAPTVIAIIGRLGGAARGVAISVYTFILFTGASLGPIVTLNLLKAGSYFWTFLGLAVVLSCGLAASCLIRMDNEV